MLDVQRNLVFWMQVYRQATSFWSGGSRDMLLGVFLGSGVVCYCYLEINGLITWGSCKTNEFRFWEPTLQVNYCIFTNKYATGLVVFVLRTNSFARSSFGYCFEFGRTNNRFWGFRAALAYSRRDAKRGWIPVSQRLVPQPFQPYNYNISFRNNVKPLRLTRMRSAEFSERDICYNVLKWTYSLIAYAMFWPRTANTTSSSLRLTCMR